MSAVSLSSYQLRAWPNLAAHRYLLANFKDATHLPSSDTYKPLMRAVFTTKYDALDEETRFQFFPAHNDTLLIVDIIESRLSPAARASSLNEDAEIRAVISTRPRGAIDWSAPGHQSFSEIGRESYKHLERRLDPLCAPSIGDKRLEFLDNLMPTLEQVLYLASQHAQNIAGFQKAFHHPRINSQLDEEIERLAWLVFERNIHYQTGYFYNQCDAPPLIDRVPLPPTSSPAEPTLELLLLTALKEYGVASWNQMLVAVPPVYADSDTDVAN